MPHPSPTVREDLFLQALELEPQAFVATGGSMWPAIPHHSTVLLEHCDPAPALWDVVLVIREGQWILHRIVGRTGGGLLLLHGDNTSGPDGWFPPSACRARATLRQTPTGWVGIPWPQPPLTLGAVVARAVNRLR